MTREQQAASFRAQLLNLYIQRDSLDDQIKALRNMIAGLEFKEQPVAAPESSPETN